MKGIAIGLSNTSKVILKRLKKTEFIDEIYIACSNQEKTIADDPIPVIKPKEVLKEKWIYWWDLYCQLNIWGEKWRQYNNFS